MGNEDNEDSLNEMLNVLYKNSANKGKQMKKKLYNLDPEDDDDNIFDQEFKRHLEKNTNRVNTSKFPFGDYEEPTVYGDYRVKKTTEVKRTGYVNLLNIRDIEGSVFEYFDKNFDKHYLMFSKKMMIQEMEENGSGGNNLYTLKKVLIDFKNSFFFKMHKIEFVKRYQQLYSIVNSGSSFILDKDVNKLVLNLQEDELFIPDDKNVISITQDNFKAYEEDILELLSQDSFDLDFMLKEQNDNNEPIELDTISYIISGIYYSDYETNIDINKIVGLTEFLFQIKTLEGIRKRIANMSVKVCSNTKTNNMRESYLGIWLSEIMDVCKKSLKNISKEFINSQDTSNLFDLFVKGFFNTQVYGSDQVEEKNRYDYMYTHPADFNDSGKKAFEGIDKIFLQQKKQKDIYAFLSAINQASFEDGKFKNKKIDLLISYICYHLISKYDKLKKSGESVSVLKEKKEVLEEIKHLKVVFEANKNKIEKEFAELSIFENLTIDEDKNIEMFSLNFNLNDFKIMSSKYSAEMDGNMFFMKEVNEDLLLFVKGSPDLKKYFKGNDLMKKVFNEYKNNKGKLDEIIDLFIKEELVLAQMRLLDEQRGDEKLNGNSNNNRVRNKI